jgi:hypothetical protein
MGKTRKYNFRKRNNKSFKRNKYLSKSRKSKNRNNILNHSFYENSKNGGYGTIIIEQSTLLDKKIKLQQSFEIFDVIKNDYIQHIKEKDPEMKLSHYLDYNLTSYIDKIVVPLIYANPFLYPLFNTFYKGLVKNKIVECDDCIEYKFSIPGTGTALYKIYKIYFTIGYIISYYYKNPSNFISEEILKKININNPILFIFKDLILNILCNEWYKTLYYCVIPIGFESFIKTNHFNVNNNTEITSLVFEFFNGIKQLPIITNFEKVHEMIHKFVDPNLNPNN